eukprot:5283799-Pyramimonas_sp.AAC.1
MPSNLLLLSPPGRLQQELDPVVSAWSSSAHRNSSRVHTCCCCCCCCPVDVPFLACSVAAGGAIRLGAASARAGWAVAVAASPSSRLCLFASRWSCIACASVRTLPRLRADSPDGSCTSLSSSTAHPFWSATNASLSLFSTSRSSNANA